MPLLGLEKVEHELRVGIKERVNDNIRGVYLSGLTNVIAGTPADEGTHRNAWLLSVGQPSSSKVSTKSKSGASSISQLNKMPKWVIGKKIFYTNHAPAIESLEYGYFPNPVKKGSYINGGYQKLSFNGFSKQASNGWVRSTLIAMQNKVRSL